MRLRGHVLSIVGPRVFRVMGLEGHVLSIVGPRGKATCKCQGHSSSFVPSSWYEGLVHDDTEGPLF
jgi:hypothetical protein